MSTLLGEVGGLLTRSRPRGGLSKLVMQSFVREAFRSLFPLGSSPTMQDRGTADGSFQER